MHSSVSCSWHPCNCSRRRLSRFFLLLQDNRPLLVYTQPDKTFLVFYSTLPSMSGFANQALSSLWITAAYTTPASPFLYTNARFCVCFPLTKEKFNAIISVTCKFSKRVTLIKSADTWSVEDWAHAFFKSLDFIDWGLSRELITDHNPKFLNRFWKALFVKLGVSLFYSTAYHPQTDGSSERINQIVEIAL